MQQEHDNQGELCTNGCGYFGSPSSGGMCSVCWKKAMSNASTLENPTSRPNSTLQASYGVHMHSITQSRNPTSESESGSPSHGTQEEGFMEASAKPTEQAQEQAQSPSESQSQEHRTTSLSMPTPTTDTTNTPPPIDGQTVATAIAIAENTTPTPSESLPKQKNRKRCYQCNKKVGLTGIECRCTYVFCGLHRYPDQHTCTFDYKKADRQELMKRNPGGGAFDKMNKL